MVRGGSELLPHQMGLARITLDVRSSSVLRATQFRGAARADERFAVCASPIFLSYSIAELLSVSMDEDGNWRLAACRNKRGDHLVNLAAMLAQDEHELNYLTRGHARR